jgi:flagellar biogenesis protein FliO
MDLVRQILSVLFVFALLGGGLWWLRRHNLPVVSRGSKRQRGVRRLEVIERVPLAPQHVLHLVRLADRGLLVAVHTSGCSLLESLPWQELEERSRGISQTEALSGGN